MYETFDTLLEHLKRDVDSGVAPEIIDYDWDDDTVLSEDSLRVTIWLKREVPND